MPDLANFEVHAITVIEGFVVLCRQCGTNLTADVEAISLAELVKRAEAHVCPPDTV